jgi:Glycoside Hydrolase Family 113
VNNIPAAALLWTCASAAALPAAAAPPHKGVALGLFAEDAGFSYRPLLEEIRATGADHVELVVAWYLEDVGAGALHDHPRFTAPPEAIERAIADAHAAGLAVLLFPIVRLERQASPDEWRGTLKPRDRAALFASYREKLVGLARLAARTRVELLSVGSELSTLDRDRAAWIDVIDAVRAVYRGPLTYSGNWDHFREVAFWDRLDFAGLCGYFALAEEGARADDEALVRAWRDLRAGLERWSARTGKPLLFTEVGYLSQRGAAAWPWNEGATEPVDLEEQRRCYAAFRRVWRGADRLGGVYFWNWYGWGGPESRGYTPRGKPAAAEIGKFFRGE